MKQKIKLFSFIIFCGILVVVSLHAGSKAREDCDKCHFYSNGHQVTQSDPFLNATHTTQLTKK